MRVRTVRPMPTQFLGFVLMLFSSKITGISWAFIALGDRCSRIKSFLYLRHIISWCFLAKVLVMLIILFVQW